MRDFDYCRALTLTGAAKEAAMPGTEILAGGTTLIDLAKCGVAAPERVLDITRLPGLDRIEETGTGLSLGALVRMGPAAADPRLLAAAPAVAQALDLAASPQLRNMATLAGNLLQRTRCPYFRDPAAFPACNKRNPGSGCAAQGGITRSHAVLGTSDDCIASYPGDLAVALIAFDAEVETTLRRMPLAALHKLPGATPWCETALQAGELVTAIHLPASAAARRSTYVKLRDRQSYEFAVVSVAAGLELAPDGTIADICIGLGGLATVPWRATAVETALKGRPFEAGAIREAAALAVEGAVADGENAVKIALAPKLVARAILSLGEPA